VNTTIYPVDVRAQLDTRLSRWLWLVKWLLALPHYVILAFLWLAFFVLSIIAFFAILFTARYPRAIFDFNVGVLRWSWRVAYYSYGALGTDRYPPFSLQEVPDYPAHLAITYPDRLSRGLVLVKWWLLAIPHYLVIGFFLSGGVYVVTEAAAYQEQPEPAAYGSGLIGLLVFIAGIVLLFTGRYPQSIFNLVVGLNRWIQRVTAYAALMTDKYPPFRLDQGGEEPNAVTLVTPSSPVEPASPATEPIPPAQR
jgi:FtsH-binding integral membrane protein